jgi:hypothetical protein
MSLLFNKPASEVGVQHELLFNKLRWVSWTSKSDLRSATKCGQNNICDNYELGDQNVLQFLDTAFETVTSRWCKNQPKHLTNNRYKISICDLPRIQKLIKLLYNLQTKPLKLWRHDDAKTNQNVLQISDTTFQTVTSRGCKTNPRGSEEFCEDISEVGWSGRQCFCLTDQVAMFKKLFMVVIYNFSL